ncbi:MAG: response regulator transcription factor [Bacteroidota bacterium]|nr:response regulator transcription factor [Candidatus Kapabacteria bacterium]MCS7302318.1 response regulator transcription factor [Candidatus Kapabacteria bacterium]MCX7936937.1 response regulator transcription factor [Chlorobiota bacterium]MDW8075284.1 response regulator transcription factor [Bacteroidota bacterium]MDW8271896.1 response regulator transcription factor [Bacteroidota bacterium]
MRILVIEDEEKVANFIRRGLEEEHYTVDVTHDGKTGIDMALKGIYDAIVLDLMLPGKDGFEVLQELRAADNDTPVLILTARGSTKDRVRGLDLGADDYLPKPFHFEELAARLRSIIRRSSVQKSSKLVVGDLVLDTTAHLAWRGDKEIELTAREYELLEFLMRNKHRVVSRTMIMQHVWNDPYNAMSNVVDVYIKRLRSKIEFDGKRFIHSIRGIGYRIKEPNGDE